MTVPTGSMVSKPDSGKVPMTEPDTKLTPRPAKTPSAIRAVLASNADPEIVEQYDKSLDLAWSESLAIHSITPLEKMLGRWWWQAVQWSDPETHRANLTRWHQMLEEGPPPPEKRMNQQQIRERYGI